MDKDRIAGAAKDVAGKVESAAGDLAGDARMQASGRAREAAGTAAREASEAAGNLARDVYENSGETIQSGTKAVARTVRDYPLGSLLIAGGIGFALALMMTRPARRSLPRRYYG